MYFNYYRDYDDLEDVCYYDAEDIYRLETEDLPLQCPYREMLPMLSYSRQGQPPSPPPSFTPQESQAQQFSSGATTFVDQGAIKPCVYRFVYIWPRRGKGFWAWLVFVGRRSVSGFRWTGRSWRYFGMDLRDIRKFQCF